MGLRLGPAQSGEQLPKALGHLLEKARKASLCIGVPSRPQLGSELGEGPEALGLSRPRRMLREEGPVERTPHSVLLTSRLGPPAAKWTEGGRHRVAKLRCAESLAEAADEAVEGRWPAESVLPHYGRPSLEGGRLIGIAPRGCLVGRPKLESKAGRVDVRCLSVLPQLLVQRPALEHLGHTGSQASRTEVPADSCHEAGRWYAQVRPSRIDLVQATPHLRCRSLWQLLRSPLRRGGRTELPAEAPSLDDGSVRKKPPEQSLLLLLRL
mmetsp:Transcript_84422/g.187503  ORF Transcript_84422/g.187503 Transcript_84422/m.187503 type:complete len:267 (+) Transcript_84422:829-1629(+)